VRGLPGAREVSNEELLTLPCDILIPAALENQIRADNVGEVRARFIAEAANGPITPDADRALLARGVPVLPDILANAGGVTVSYFEWVQNIENEQWDEGKVNAKLQQKMERGTDAVLDKHDEVNDALPALEDDRRSHGLSGPPLEPIDLRTAAQVLAIERVAKATLDRGIWP
jgi:glutamate dehydrogenase (NAD(P)+)